MSDSPHPLSRRTFLGASAIAAATPSLLVTPARARTDRALHVGLIGCGGRGTGAATQALNADEGVVITAMADMFTDRMDSSHAALTKHAPMRVQVPAERRFLGFDAYQRLLETDVDVVLLATPPHFRPAHLAAAVDAGKHVFCEKPMAVDGKGVRSVMQTAASAAGRGLSLVAGFCWRYSLPERATYARLHDGAIGRIGAVHTTYHASPLGQRPRQDGWTDMEWQLRNWWHFRWLSGDHLVEQACHSVDKIAWAMGDRTPVRANALGGRFMREGAESGNVYDHFTVIFEYEDGARGFHTCRQMPHCNYDNTDYVIGSEGTCYVNGWAPTHVIEGANPWRYEGPRANMYQVEHDELFASIRAGEPINDGRWMAQSTLMSIMGRLAAYTGQTVTWDDALDGPEDWTPPAYALGPIDMPPVAKPGTYVPGPWTT